MNYKEDSIIAALLFLSPDFIGFTPYFRLPKPQAVHLSSRRPFTWRGCNVRSRPGIVHAVEPVAMSAFFAHLSGHLRTKSKKFVGSMAALRQNRLCFFLRLWQGCMLPYNVSEHYLIHVDCPCIDTQIQVLFSFLQSYFFQTDGLPVGVRSVHFYFSCEVVSVGTDMETGFFPVGRSHKTV